MGTFAATCAISGLTIYNDRCDTGLVFLSVLQTLPQHYARDGGYKILTPPIWGTYDMYGGIEPHFPEGNVEKLVLDFLQIHIGLDWEAKTWAGVQNLFSLLHTRNNGPHWIVPALVRRDVWKAMKRLPKVKDQWPQSEGETWATLMPRVLTRIQAAGGFWKYMSEVLPEEDIEQEAARVLQNPPLGVHIPDLFRWYYTQNRVDFDPQMNVSLIESLIVCQNMHLMSKSWLPSLSGNSENNHKQVASLCKALLRITKKKIPE
jgi:hypothetical protein